MKFTLQLTAVLLLMILLALMVRWLAVEKYAGAPSTWTPDYNHR